MTSEVRQRRCGGETSTMPHAPANDPRQLRIGVLEGVTPTRIHELAQGRVACRREALRRIIDDALAEVPGIGEVDVQLGYHAAGVYVVGDRVQLVQLFANLFANAVQAMHESPVKKLCIVTAAAGGDTLIRIEDSGPGLSARIHAQLFEPLVPARPDGSGLGLPICATIVRTHKGRIWVDPPEAGAGAAFNLSLPARMVLTDDAA